MSPAAGITPDDLRYEAVALELEQRRAELALDLTLILGTLDEALREAQPWARARVTGRIKCAPSIWIKMYRYRLAFEEVYDLLGVRVVVERVHDCYAAAAVVRALWPDRCVREHDYIANPKDNGYRSLHLCIRDPGWPPFEVQLRTAEMNRVCLAGAAAHERYKASVWRSFIELWGEAVGGVAGGALP